MISQIELVSSIFASLEKAWGVKFANARQMNAVIEAANIIVAAFDQEHRPAVAGSGLAAWLASDDTGASSKYMAQTLVGRRPGQIDYPHDPDDFGRCVRLLESVPELRDKLPMLSDGHGSIWSTYVANWTRMEELYREELPSGRAPRLYDLMRALQLEARDGGAA